MVTGAGFEPYVEVRLGVKSELSRGLLDEYPQEEGALPGSMQW